MNKKNENIRNLNESEFLSFLYAEKDRLHTNFSKPGWSNWAIGGTFVALVVYAFNIFKELTTTSSSVDWSDILMLFIGFSSLLIVVMMAYPLLFPKEEIYYPNRLTTLWDEIPIFDLVYTGVLYLVLSILLIICNNYSWILFVFVFVALSKLVIVYLLWRDRNKLVSSGTKYSIIPNNWIGLVQRSIDFGLFILIAVYSFWKYVPKLNQHLNELHIAAVILGFWSLVYIFFKTNSTSNRMLNGIDNIIDKYVYSNISQQSAIEELTCLRYGSNVHQIVKNDLSSFMTAQTKLENINAKLDVIIKTIEEGNLTVQLFYEWLGYYKKERQKLTDARFKGEKLVKRLVNISKIPNDVKHSGDFKSLIDLTESGLGKIGATQGKFSMILDRLITFRETYYCRKSGSVCLDLECKNRNNKMSIKYALKVFPLKHVLFLIIYRKR